MCGRGVRKEDLEVADEPGHQSVGVLGDLKRQVAADHPVHQLLHILRELLHALLHALCTSLQHLHTSRLHQLDMHSERTRMEFSNDGPDGHRQSVVVGRGEQ